jgi:hypothetical protein
LQPHLIGASIGFFDGDARKKQRRIKKFYLYFSISYKIFVFFGMGVLNDGKPSKKKGDIGVLNAPSRAQPPTPSSTESRFFCELSPCPAPGARNRFPLHPFD